MPCETRILWMLFAVWLIIIYELKVTFSYFRLDEAFILSPSYVHQHFFYWGQFSLMIQSVGYTGNSQAMSSIPVPRMEFIYFNTYVLHLSMYHLGLLLLFCLYVLICWCIENIKCFHSKHLRTFFVFVSEVKT